MISAVKPLDANFIDIEKSHYSTAIINLLFMMRSIILVLLTILFTPMTYLMKPAQSHMKDGSG